MKKEVSVQGLGSDFILWSHTRKTALGAASAYYKIIKRIVPVPLHVIFVPFILLRACQLFLVCNNTSSDKCKGRALNCLQSHFMRLVRVFLKQPNYYSQTGLSHSSNRFSVPVK